MAAPNATPVAAEDLLRENIVKEIKLTGFFAEHNISFNTADHLIDLLKNILPDSQIVKKNYPQKNKNPFTNRKDKSALQR